MNTKTDMHLPRRGTITHSNRNDGSYESKKASQGTPWVAFLHSPQVTCGLCNFFRAAREVGGANSEFTFCRRMPLRALQGRWVLKVMQFRLTFSAWMPLRTVEGLWVLKVNYELHSDRFRIEPGKEEKLQRTRVIAALSRNLTNARHGGGHTSLRP